MLDQMAFAGIERLHFAQDPQTGMRAIIAIHSTLRGPSIGGCRFLHYPREQDAITDVIRLARGMSYKSALAGLPHGGGKAVLLKPESSFNRSELMAAFGRMVEQLGGDYIAAMDSGTRVTDMDTIATQTGHVTCTTAFGDPSDRCVARRLPWYPAHGPAPYCDSSRSATAVVAGYRATVVQAGPGCPGSGSGEFHPERYVPYRFPPMAQGPLRRREAGGCWLQ